jgi:hypothetical protein
MENNNNRDIIKFAQLLLLAMIMRERGITIIK